LPALPVRLPDGAESVTMSAVDSTSMHGILTHLQGVKSAANFNFEVFVGDVPGIRVRTTDLIVCCDAEIASDSTVTIYVDALRQSIDSLRKSDVERKELRRR
jgi:hypothetical protein